MASPTNPYFDSALHPVAGSSTVASASVSPNASGLLSPSSCSTAVSNLSLNFDDSRSRSPSTSACTSVSDASSEIPSIGAHAKSVSPEGLISATVDDDDDEEDHDAAERREQDELDSALVFGTQIVQREARALAMAARRLSKLAPQKDGFREAIKLVLRATNGERGGKVVLTGVGKSGIIARKLSATFLSLGTPSMFLHPVEALHGDLGLLTPHRDVVLALSYSGSSPELLALIPHLNSRKCPIIALVGRRESALVDAADAWIDCGTGKDDDSDDEADDDDDDDEARDVQDGAEQQQQREAAHATALESGHATGAHVLLHRTLSGASAGRTPSLPKADPSLSTSDDLATPCCACTSGRRSTRPNRPRAARPTTDEAWDEVPAPSSSTTVALAMGDALAFSVTRAKGLGREMFAFNHPGGKLGADFRMQGHPGPLPPFEGAVGAGSTVATPIAG